MKWKRKPSTVKARLAHYERKMERALTAASTSGDIERCKSKRSKWLELERYASSIDSTFMSLATFSEWLRGNRLVMLKDPSSTVINHYFRRYFGDDERVDSGNESD